MLTRACLEFLGFTSFASKDTSLLKKQQQQHKSITEQNFTT